MTKLDSVTIVKGKSGSVATIRFSNPDYDKILSSSNRLTLYMLIEEYVQKVIRRE